MDFPFFSFFCRYGDLCPKSVPAKIFAMVWFVVGLVIFSVFMGALASLLTVTTVKQTLGSPSGTDTKTVTSNIDFTDHEPYWRPETILWKLTSFSREHFLLFQ